MKPLNSRDRIGGSFVNDFAPRELEHLFEWIRLDASVVRNNRPCVEQHLQNLRARGETEERLNELHRWRVSPFFTEWEKAALGLSETISLHASEKFSTQVLKDVRRHFSVEDVLQLTLTTMAINDWIDLHEISPVRILVIEDDPSDQELLLRQLRKRKMDDQVLCLSDGSQAIKYVEKHITSPEMKLIAIFLDIRLPRMSGVEVLQRLRTMPGMENFPVIVMTSSNDPRDLQECQKLRVMSYVQKPITFDSFSGAIANIFHQSKQEMA